MKFDVCPNCNMKWSNKAHDNFNFFCCDFYCSPDFRDLWKKYGDYNWIQWSIDGKCWVFDRSSGFMKEIAELNYLPFDIDFDRLSKLLLLV
jgi:hypothetical protein